jgi:hypothetical protein
MMHAETPVRLTKNEQRQRGLQALEDLTQPDDDDLNERDEEPWFEEEVEIHYGEPVDEYAWRELLAGVAEQAFETSPEDFADLAYSEIRGQSPSGSEAATRHQEFLNKPPQNAHEWRAKIDVLSRLWRNPLQSLLDAAPNLQAYVNVGRSAHRTRSQRGRSDIAREAVQDTESTDSDQD